MRPLLAPLALATLCVGCAVKNPGQPPDTSRFYYPTGIAWQPDPDGGGPGFLYVVSSDFDLRFNRGTVASVDVSMLEPTLDAALFAGDAGSSATPPLQRDGPFPDGGGTWISSIVTLDPFSGPVSLFTKPDGSARLFVVGREDNLLQGVDLSGTGMTCAGGGSGNDCTVNAMVLASSQLDQERDAYRPFVTTDGQVYVSHITPIDHPYGSNTNFTATVAFTDALSVGQPDAGAPGWVQIGVEAADGLAQVGRLLYISGRAFTSDTNATPLRRLNLDAPSISLVDSTLPLAANVLDTRAMAVSSDGMRLFMVVRDPDGLLTLDMTPGLDGYPTEAVLSLVELPPGAEEIAVIPRPGQRDAIAVTCTDDGSVALYDDQLQIVESVVHGVGLQPFAIAVAARPISSATAGVVGARLFVTAFGEGSVAVVDLPNLSDLTQAQVLLTFGPNENCLNDDVQARPPGCP